MTEIFKEIRNTIDGIIGSYIMNMEGEILAHDVPSLFENELINVSHDLFQLIDIVKSERAISSIEVKADQGFIQLAVSDNYILGTFASKHADESLLTLVVNKAITSITPEDIVSIGAKPPVSEAPAATATPSTETQAEPVPVVDDEVRVALCQAVKSKIKILYGDKMAETKVSEAFEQAGAKRDTRNRDELKAVFDILGDGIIAKMMGKNKAEKFLDDLYKKHGLK